MFHAKISARGMFMFRTCLPATGFTAARQRFLRLLARVGPALGGLFLFASTAFAEEAAPPPAFDSGDTTWLLVSSALVFLMLAPGLALFYGGLVGQRNVLSTIMHSFFSLALISVVWVLWGYSLAFGTDISGVIGGLEYLGFNGISQAITGTVPMPIFAMFQLMFAALTVALISGAIAERMKFSAWVLFSLFWITLVYAPLAHWVWGGGWLMKLGALDFAGGTVVHISSGVSALVAALLVGRRLGYPEKVLPPHSVPLTVIGASLLWFGWFGFNAGSALSAGSLASIAFATTNTAAAVAAVTWAFIEWAVRGKPTALGAATGAVAGLVAITPAAGFVTVPASLAIGLGAGIICYLGVNALKPRLGYDDSLDVFGVHGLGGTWGAIATGLFASKVVNPAGADGLLFGNPDLMINQLIGVGASWALAIVGTFVILKIVSAITGLRVTKEEEVAGLDLSLHGESAYNMLPPGMSGFSDASPRESYAARPGTVGEARTGV